METHLDRLHDLSCENSRSFQSKKLITDAYQKEKTESNKRRKNSDTTCCVSLHKNTLHKIRFPAPYTGNLFDEPTYREFKDSLNPPYTTTLRKARRPDTQRSKSGLIVSAPKARAKIRGLAGSGTAGSSRWPPSMPTSAMRGKVLILTFNITLGSHIHDKISLRSGRTSHGVPLLKFSTTIGSLP